MIEDRLIILSREQKPGKKRDGVKSWARNWKKKAASERVVLWIMFVFFIIYGFSLIYPLIWALINSFKTQVEYDISSFKLPEKPTLQAYVNVFTMLKNNDTNMVESIWNSIWMSFLSTFLGLVASSLTAYVVSKYRFKMSGFIYGLAIFIQIIPLVGGVTGMYNLIWNTLQIGDKPLLIWPIWFGGFSFSFLMLYSAFKSVPWSYAESAFIDGAGHFKTFIKIMLPSVKPVLSSLFVVNFIGAWNDYMTSYLYIPSYKPLAYNVYALQSDATRISYPVYLAVIVISVIPTIILFVSFQKLIMENTTTGGLKG